MYQLEEKDGMPVVRVRGDIDVTSAGEFRNSLSAALERSVGRIVVALEECTYFDSTAVGVLVGTLKKAGNRLVIVVPASGIVRRVLDLTGVTRYVAIATSLAEAVSTPWPA